MIRKDEIKIRRGKAWLLLVVLGSLFFIKSFHYHNCAEHYAHISNLHDTSCGKLHHNEYDSSSSFLENQQLKTIHECSICDFTLSAFTEISREDIAVPFREYSQENIYIPHQAISDIAIHFYLRAPPVL